MKETPEGKWNDREEKGFKKVKAKEMERTGEMGERVFEIKRKQSLGRDGQIDNMKQQYREEGEEELGHGEKGVRQ